MMRRTSSVLSLCSPRPYIPRPSASRRSRSLARSLVIQSGFVQTDDSTQSETTMTLVERRRFDDDWIRNRDSFFSRDDMWNDWRDWPVEWPRPRDLIDRFHRDIDSWWRDWPTDWPRMDAVMPALTRNLDRMDSNWRDHPFWRGRYPDWAEPTFKAGIDVHSNIVNDGQKFAVELDCFQFQPEEIEVKTMGDTLMVEGRHEDVKDRDNYTKMYFVRKYQLPRDIDPLAIQSSIDSRRMLTIEAPKRHAALGGRERVIPIEGTSGRRSHSRSRHDSGISNGHSPRGPTSPLTVDPGTRDVHVPYNDSVREAEYQERIRREREREIHVPFNDPAREADWNDSRRRERDNYQSQLASPRVGGRTGALADGGSFQESRYYHRTESRTSNTLSPHEVDKVTSSNENRAYSPRRASFDVRDDTRGRSREREQMSPGRGFFDSIRDKFEKGFRSSSRAAESRSESRQSGRGDFENGYRVETPISVRRCDDRDAGSATGGEAMRESVRSVRIERKSHY